MRGEGQLCFAVPTELVGASKGVLLIHPAAVFAAREHCPWETQDALQPFRMGIRAGPDKRRYWVPLRVLPAPGRGAQLVAPDALIKALAEDLCEQIQRYERGDPFDSAPLVPAAEDGSFPLVQQSVAQLFNLLWGPETIAAACIGGEAWPLAPAAPGEQDVEVVAVLGRVCLASTSQPIPTMQFVRQWSILVGAEQRRRTASVTRRSASGQDMHPSPSTTSRSFGRWTLTYDSDALVVELNCGKFLLQDFDGTWWLPEQQIVLRAVLSPGLIRALVAGHVSAEYMLRSVTSAPRCHPHVSEEGHICYGGDQRLLARDFYARSNPRPSVMIIWALLEAARILRRGHIDGASNFRSFAESGWQRVENPSAPHLASLPKYPCRRPPP